MQDFGLIDLPYPLRKLRLNPIGMLTVDVRDEADKEDILRFHRGVDAFPSVGDSVLLPTKISCDLLWSQVRINMLK